MERSELKGLFKGIGIASIVCAAIFYMMVLNLRTDFEAQEMTDTVLIQKARDLGMVHVTDTSIEEALTDTYIKERAKALGMVEPIE